MPARQIPGKIRSSGTSAMYLAGTPGRSRVKKNGRMTANIQMTTQMGTLSPPTAAPQGKECNGRLQGNCDAAHDSEEGARP